MKAVILAAGRGNRMGSLTNNKPKCLVELADKPLIQWQIEALKKAGITEIAIVKGYLSDKIAIPEIKYFKNIRWSRTNMVMSLLSAENWLKKYNCVVSYADIVYPADTVSKLIKKKGDILITYDSDWLKLWRRRFNNPLSDAETFRIGAGGILLEIGNRAESIDEIRGQYMGLLKFTPCGWKSVEKYLSGLTSKELDFLDMTSLLRGLLKSGVLIKTVPIKGKWFEVDSENDLKLYNSLIRKSPEKIWL